MDRVNLLLIGEYGPSFAPHAATNEAIGHSGVKLGLDIETTWASTDDVEDEDIVNTNGLGIAPGGRHFSMQYV